MCDVINWRETRTNLTDSFRLERGGQFESGFQSKLLTHVKILLKKVIKITVVMHKISIIFNI
jgi:hypothetical protein